ncbi:MAG TPA: AAA family ATPase [Polyangiaceae bacterium]|nr:AAA family ATPase [Polyangiaceae bacterium]
MRIAISGSHRTGKSTLLAELSGLLPDHATVDEPYHSLEEEGHEFSHPPSVEDFEAMIERSLVDLEESDDDVLFDRCPLDALAYLVVHPDAEDFDFEDSLARVREALERIDLLVFVPIEARDRIAVSAADDEGSMRESVDEKLREILIDDAWQLGVEVIEVSGDVEARARTVASWVRRASRSSG